MHQGKKLVSVIMPTHNRVNLISRAIDSVLKQTFSEWELIIVDDASEDNTQTLVKEYLDKDKRIKYIKLDTNKGACVARNEGILASTGNFITFLDSDDEYLPQKIELQLKCFENSIVQNLGVVSCGRLDARDGKVYSRWTPKFSGNILKNLLAKDRVGAGTPFLMLKSSIIRKNNILFDPKMPAGQDWDFLIRICQHVNFDYVPEPLVKVHHHAGERVYTNARALNALDIQYGKYKALLDVDPAVHDKFVLKKAQLNFLYGHHAKAQNILEKEVKNKKLGIHLWQLYFKFFKTYSGFISLASYKLLTKLTTAAN